MFLKQAHRDAWQLYREEATTVIRLRTGHCRPRARGWTDVILQRDIAMRSTKADQTPEHVLQVCQPHMTQLDSQYVARWSDFQSTALM
jgi:hypothetical protein